MRKTIVLYYLIVKPIPGGLISELLPFWCHIAHNCLTAPAQMLELQMMVPTTSSTGLARRQLTFIVRLSACIAVIAVLIALVPAGQSWVIKQESTNIWTGHMLAGTGGYHMALGGDRWQISDHTAVTTWLGTWPWIGDQSLRNRQIFVANKTGIGGSGWVVSGGPVDSIEVAGAWYELYGRAIDRYDPGSFEGVHNQNKTVYDFYLVSRKATSSRGAIVKSWVGLTQHALSGRSVGTMTYDSNTHLIRVNIADPQKIIVSENVDLDILLTD